MDKIFEVVSILSQTNEAEIKTTIRLANALLEAKKINPDCRTDNEHSKEEGAVFENLKWLYDNEHLIVSIAPLADCYRYGYGCEVDKNMAQKLYFEGMLFAIDRQTAEYCRGSLAEHLLMSTRVGGEKWNRAFKSIKEKETDDDLDSVRLYIAGLILDGQLKDYKPEIGFVILQNVKPFGFDSMGEMHLGECYYFGIGTERNIKVAENLFKSAILWIPMIKKDIQRGVIRDDYYSIDEYDEAIDRLTKYLEGIEIWKKNLTTEKYGEMVELLDEEVIWNEFYNNVIYRF